MTNEEAKEFLDNLKICISEHPIVADWLVEIVDRKTEPQKICKYCNGKCSWWVDGDCRNDDCRLKPKDEPQTDPLPKAINGVNISDAVAWADKWLEDNPVSEMWDMIRTLRDATEWQDEPQTNADQHTQSVESVESVGSNLEPFRVDEPQTERSE